MVGRACTFLLNFAQVTVKADETQNTIFHFKCPGNSSHSHTLLLNKDGQVNRQIAEVCGDRFVRVAFHEGFDVDNETNTMIEYESSIEYESLIPSYSWEILSSFFANNRLTPIFIDCKKHGWLDEDTGLWNGAVATVDSLDLFLLS